MSFIYHLFLGFVTALVASLAPGMLNMTAVQTRLKKGDKAALQFSFGAALVLSLYSFLAMIFTRYILENPVVIERIQKAAIGIFVGLAVFFFFQARQKVAEAKEQKESRNQVVTGAIMAMLNALVVPFYLSATSYFIANNYMVDELVYRVLFSAGVFFGALTLFYIYRRFAKIIQEKAQFIARNINYILSGLFVVLALIQVIANYR